jgi:hypothetical protein
VCVCVLCACVRASNGFHSSNCMPLIIFQKFSHQTEKQVFMSSRPMFFQPKMTRKFVGYELVDTNIRDKVLAEAMVVPTSFFIIKHSFTGNKLF